jgi:G:T-mismatch repair DNA endonuclease (very short patch repair protein)
LPNEYKYVGSSDFWIEGLNPDFINCNGQKKIIELFGDYWHNREDSKIRDKKRLKIYKKYGYETLVVWEKELKDMNKLKTKLINFNKK